MIKRSQIFSRPSATSYDDHIYSAGFVEVANSCGYF